MKGIVQTNKQLIFYEQEELVKCFCFLGERLNTNCESEAAMVKTKKSRWIKFKESGELLHERKLYRK